MATHPGRSPRLLRFTALVVTALLMAFLGWYTNYRWHHRRTSPKDPLLKQVLMVKSTERVDLRGRPISDSDVACLKELPNLKCLILWSTNISDRGLADVVQIKSIRQLCLPGGISDGGMALLQQLPSLEVLDLQECTHLGETGFKNVEKLQGLKYILLNRTFPPPQELVEQLRQALPTCEINM